MLRPDELRPVEQLVLDWLQAKREKDAEYYGPSEISLAMGRGHAANWSSSPLRVLVLLGHLEWFYGRYRAKTATEGKITFEEDGN